LNNFFRRTLTGAGIVIFILGGFWLHPVTFFITGLILVIGLQYEYYSLIASSGIHPRTWPGIIAGAGAYILSTLVAAEIITGRWMLLLVIPFSVITIAELYRKEAGSFDILAHTFFPFFYSVLPLALFPFSAYSMEGLPALLQHERFIFSPAIIIGFFLLVWANDTGAYLFGITFGKHRLFERISPKKSWEGFFGGMVIAVIAAWFLAGWLGVVERQDWIITAIIVSVAGTYGDLVESMLKRSTGVKDSGSIFPGHGGFLDRFDSTLIAFPLVYLFITLVA
jgi:phosphatidate cytidylyltransferase